jgi:hypothetical protein
MSPDKLFDYLDGKLSPADRAQVEERLMADPQLRQQFNIAREIHRSGRESREVVMPIEDRCAGAKERCPREAHRGRSRGARRSSTSLRASAVIAWKNKKGPNPAARETEMREQLAASLGAARKTRCRLHRSLRMKSASPFRGTNGNMSRIVCSPPGTAFGGSAVKGLPEENLLVVVADIPYDPQRRVPARADVCGRDHAHAFRRAGANRRAHRSGRSKRTDDRPDSHLRSGAMIAVTFALPAESSDFIRLLQDCERTDACVAGRLHNHVIRVLHTGVGERVARERVAAFLANSDDPQLVISAGFAGATTDTLQPGDLLLAENIGAPELLAATRSALVRINVRAGKLATAPAVIDSGAERAALAETADAVDMETRMIAASCAERGIPVLSLRAITDTPSFPFPAPAHVLFDVEQQRTVASRLVLYLATHPLAIAKLVAFAKRVSAARAGLAAALDLLLRSEAFAARFSR